MKTKIKYELKTRLAFGEEVSCGLFDTYEEAQEEAVFNNHLLLEDEFPYWVEETTTIRIFPK